MTKAERFQKLAAELAAEFTDQKSQRRVAAVISEAGERPMGWDLKGLERIARGWRSKRRNAEEKHEIDGWHTAEYPHRFCRKCEAAGWL